MIVMLDAFTGVINPVDGVAIVVVANSVVIDGATNPLVVVAIVVVSKPIVTEVNSVVVGSAVGPEIEKNN